MGKEIIKGSKAIDLMICQGLEALLMDETLITVTRKIYFISGWVKRHLPRTSEKIIEVLEVLG